MLPPADFRLAKIVAEIVSSKQKVLPLIHRMAKRFRRCGDIRRNTRIRRNTTFCSIVCCELFFNDCCWRDFASSSIFSRRYCVRYRCNRPLLYLTEEHSIRWKFCLVYQKRFHLSWSASENELVRTHKDRTQETAEIEPTCFRGGEFELHPRFHVKYLAWSQMPGGLPGGGGHVEASIWPIHKR